MIIAEACYDEMINNVARSIGARVELLEGDSILQTFTHDGALQGFSVERIGDSAKFFGYGICQKLTVKLRDKDRTINIVKGQKLDVAVGVGCDYLYTLPVFFVEEVKRNENTNELEIVAYDAIYSAASHTVSELTIGTSYTMYAYAAACAAVLGMPIRLENVNDTIFNTEYPTGANLSAEGTETIRQVLDDIAEATGTVYYMCRNWCITFKRLNIDGDPVLNIDKHKYFTLDVKTVHTLASIVSATELGDNVGATKQVVIGIGKNLLSYPYHETTKTENGITFTDNGDGTITVNGTATAAVEFNFTAQNPNFNWLENNTYYYFSGSPDSTKVSMRTYYTDADGAKIQKQGRVVWRSDYVLNKFAMQIAEGTTLENVLIQPMVAQTANATAYEPYTEYYESIMGETQYLRDNAFLDIRDDVGTLVKNVVEAVGGLTIAQFDCKWRGNFLLEIGDKISFVTKDDSVVNTYILNDIITYNGGLTQKTKWDYSGSGAETLTNPVTLGESLKQTYARVDKANKQITLLASETEANKESIAALEVNTGSISASVSNIEKNFNDSLEGVNSDIDSLRQEVETKMTETDLTIKITEELAKGTTSVTTETGYKFDKDGLLISKSGSEMSTQVTDDGMKVYKDDIAVLSATSVGVDAVNLHATTYLIIGRNSRFEDYDGNRTGCFFIG